MENALIRRVGRRGAVLLFLALLDVIYAGSLYWPLDESKRSASTAFLASVLPLQVWGTLWLAVGLVLAVGAFSPRHDRWAYAAAAGLKTLWGLTNLFGWLVVGVDRGWVSAVIWLAFAGLVLMISSWSDPLRDHFGEV